MRSIFKHIILLALAISVYAQQAPDSISVSDPSADSVKVSVEAPAAVLTDEEKLCREVAEDIMKIYDSWSPERDYKILYPRVKGFVDDFYNEYPDFGMETIVKDQLFELYKEKINTIDNINEDYPDLISSLESEYPSISMSDVINEIKKTDKLSDLEKRSLVAFNGMKNNKIFEEVARFITTKDFYWGYISDDLNNSINKAADKLKRYTLSRKDILRADHEKYVESLLLDSRKFDRQLDSVKAISDEKVIDDLLADENYNNEMMAIEFKIDSAKTKPEVQAVLEQLYRDKDQRILDYIVKKKKELIENKRAEKIAAKDWWVEEKRQTIFDLLELEKARLSEIVSAYTVTLEEERNIVAFDITAEFVKHVKESDPKIEEEFKLQIKHKFYSGLVGAFGSAVIYDEVPVFRTFRFNVLMGSILFMILFFYIYVKVKKNREEMYIRRIPGLDAIDDAVGRATEMGKPIIYDSGIGTYTDIETIASMLILRSVAKKVAEFKAEIYVPTCEPIVMQISEEMVASGFLDAGYPEDHKKENVFYLAADQFAFAAGIAGILSRKKPAAAFHFGYYMAESLLISEAGFAAGAIQVAGTTQATQLPFFITACDYTLIGEELYAAAAYISRDAQIMTNLKLSDYAKIVIGFIFIAGTIILTINSEWTFFQDILYTR
jgi:hypothetical protein